MSKKFSSDPSLLESIQGAERDFLRGRRERGEDLESAVRIFLEFLRGFEALVVDGPCVTVFGPARFPESHPHYELARALGRKLAEAGSGRIRSRKRSSTFERVRRMGVDPATIVISLRATLLISLSAMIPETNSTQVQ